jgi:peptide/nickel transport system permease protein/oligopeptide transport system permease protein
MEEPTPREASHAAVAAPGAPGALRARRSPVRVFLSGPAVRLSIAIILLVVAGAALGPLFLPAAYQAPTALQLSPPSAAHWLGTDLNGRDLLYRVFIGARISLIVGLAGALVSLFIGTAYGLVAGYAGGGTDTAMMRAVDVIYAIPRLIFIIILINVVEFRFRGWLQGVFGNSPLLFLRALPSYSKTVILILSLGLVEWLTMARIVRGQVLVLKNLPFVTAARGIGQSHSKILWHHLLPNLTGIIAVYLTLTIPAVILDESFLSYLGLGVDASQASWGTLLSDGAQAVNPIKSSWWLLVFPASILSATLLALNFLGDGLRDALDPRSR